MDNPMDRLNTYSTKTLQNVKYGLELRMAGNIRRKQPVGHLQDKLSAINAELSFRAAQERT